MAVPSSFHLLYFPCVLSTTLEQLLSVSAQFFFLSYLCTSGLSFALHILCNFRLVLCTSHTMSLQACPLHFTYNVTSGLSGLKMLGDFWQFNIDNFVWSKLSSNIEVRGVYYVKYYGRGGGDNSFWEKVKKQKFTKTTEKKRKGKRDICMNNGVKRLKNSSFGI